jgi:hypothetical protein
MGTANKVIFKTERVSDGDWQIVAHCPGAEIRYITGLKDEAEAKLWETKYGPAWLKQNGFTT